MEFRRVWGQAAAAVADRTRRIHWVDLLILIGLAGLIYQATIIGGEWKADQHTKAEIDLSPVSLLQYTLFSLSRGLIAYICSLLFTLVYGYYAAKDPIAERLLVPLLDILQSIPVLSFMPGVVLLLVKLFPNSNAGLELAAILMIFTGQAWNMTFSFYHSVKSVPLDQREVATIYRMNWWQRFRWVELPYSTMGLVWNSMMSMAGGWFFLMISESFSLGEGKNFRLPGLGSYMSVAVKRGDTWAMVWAVLAMFTMIIALDQLLWRPVVVWAQKFRIEEGGNQVKMTSWMLDFLRRSKVIEFFQNLLAKFERQSAKPAKSTEVVKPPQPVPAWLSWTAIGLFGMIFAYGGWKLLDLLSSVPRGQWLSIGIAGGWTLGRVLISLVLGTLWALPAGLAIGLSPKLSRVLQPVVQVLASFPAPMLFPAVIAVLAWSGVPLGWGSIVLMLLGTQWYILFNVIAGSMAIPSDLKEASNSFSIRGWQRFRVLYFPAVLSYLVTGWVTAAGGAWNASIVSEYVTMRASVEERQRAHEQTVAAISQRPDAARDDAARDDVQEPKGEVIQVDHGLGALISEAADSQNFSLLAASTLVMSIIVVTFNRTVWRRIYHVAETRYSLNK